MQLALTWEMFPLCFMTAENDTRPVPSHMQKLKSLPRVSTRSRTRMLRWTHSFKGLYCLLHQSPSTYWDAKLFWGTTPATHSRGSTPWNTGRMLTGAGCAPLIFLPFVASQNPLDQLHHFLLCHPVVALWM